MLRFDDRINDMDMFSKFKYTIKGPNAIGGSNDNVINKRFRDIHPSFLGKIDINVCGNSDPGTSGLITPFAKTEGLYFNGEHEPEDAIFKMEKEVNAYYKENNKDKEVIDLYEDCDTVDDVFAKKEKMQKIIDGITIKHIKTEDPDKIYVRVTSEDTDLDI